MGISAIFKRSGRTKKIVSLITLYRIVTSPLLLVLLFVHQYNIFKWLLLLSFLTDLVDGYIARKYKVTSVLGARLDSIGDDLTILVAVIGVFLLRFDFIKQEMTIVIILLSLFFIQLLLALYHYGRITSFHTYGAKAAAVLQGSFLLSLFFFKEPVCSLFYFAAAVTSLELIEEIILVFLLPTWQHNVKGLYWVLRRRNSQRSFNKQQVRQHKGSGK